MLKERRLDVNMLRNTCSQATNILIRRNTTMDVNVRHNNVGKERHFDG